MGGLNIPGFLPSAAREGRDKFKMEKLIRDFSGTAWQEKSLSIPKTPRSCGGMFIFHKGEIFTGWEVFL